MPIPTEPVGSLPRPAKLQAAYADSIKRMEATGSPIVSDGEQRVSSFATYPVTDTLAGTGLADHLAGDGQYFAIFADGHHRQLPRLTGGPFRYKTYAAEFTEKAMKMATKPLKQAVIAPSMLALLYPLDGEVKVYSREQIPQRSLQRMRKGHSRGLQGWRSPRFDRLHGGAARVQERSEKSLDRTPDACGLHRPQQSGD